MALKMRSGTKREGRCLRDRYNTSVLITSFELGLSDIRHGRDCNISVIRIWEKSIRIGGKTRTGIFFTF